FIIFVFASSRRHTRFSRDWSSDVCSSDLAAEIGRFKRNTSPRVDVRLLNVDIVYLADRPDDVPVVAGWLFDEWGHLRSDLSLQEIGRASCREVGISSVGLFTSNN